MLTLVLMAGIATGLTALIITDSKVRALDGTRTQAFYTAHAGLENLTASLGNLFDSNYAPSGAQINALTTTPPNLGATWTAADGTSGYTITYPKDANGNPVASTMTVTTGPFQGLIGQATPYQMAVTAHLPDGSEASLTRTLQTVSIPVFQFGLFSENDLSFFAGPNFNFGGRVHTNSNLYLASGDGSTLTMSDKVTAVGEVIRTNLSNGWPLTSNYNGTVNLITAPNAYRALATNEGSLVGNVGTAFNEPKWTNLSTGNYNHNVANGRTGAKQLTLPITNFGAQPIDLIRRGLPNENTANPLVYNERYYSFASLRILLSDNAADITGLPGVTATAPVPLGNAVATAIPGYSGPPLAVAPNMSATTTNRGYGIRMPLGTPMLGGYIKIERQDTGGVWHDVTLEILNLGIADRQWPTPVGTACGDPNPAAVAGKAILLLERPRDNSGACLTTPIPFTTTGANDMSPNALYDTREGIYRDGVATTAPIEVGGVMYYIGLDVKNLSRWFSGTIGTTGAGSMNVTGYVVYFSDRRGNHNAANAETAEFGFEDIVNPLSASGTPNGALDTGEDVNGNGLLDTYGATPIPPNTAPGGAALTWANIAAVVAGNPYVAAMKPSSTLEGNPATTLGPAIARRNPPVFFRRALKLVNGSLGNIIAPGLTVVSENPVYIQGDWNANGGFGDPHVATAVIADSVTLLSNNWDDRNSFTGAHDLTQRTATTTWYRVAVIAGKGIPFPQPAGTAQDFGTDGGAHNFLRYIENWGGQTLNYRGSIVSFYRSRQAVGIYKCCTDVYSPPTRGYNFDVDFLTPALLPPRTPMFRDVNTTGFAQIIRPH